MMPLTAIYLFSVTIFTTYFGLKYPNYFYPLLIINLAAILGASIPPASLHENILRVLAVIVVAIVVILFQIIFMPGFLRREGYVWTLKSIQNLDFVSREIFACFLQPEYADNVYLFERRLHVRKKQFMRGINKLRRAAYTSEEKNHAEKIDQLYDILMDCAQLRRRVSDHTVFSLCSKEMSGIANEFKILFAEMKSVTKSKATDVSLDTLSLADKIKLFENIFQSVIRVAAREPLAFLLFIGGLKAFREKAGQYTHE